MPRHRRVALFSHDVGAGARDFAFQFLDIGSEFGDRQRHQVLFAGCLLRGNRSFVFHVSSPVASVARSL